MILGFLARLIAKILSGKEKKSSILANNSRLAKIVEDLSEKTKTPSTGLADISFQNWDPTQFTTLSQLNERMRGPSMLRSTGNSANLLVGPGEKLLLQSNVPGHFCILVRYL